MDMAFDWNNIDSAFLLQNNNTTVITKNLNEVKFANQSRSVQKEGEGDRKILPSPSCKRKVLLLKIAPEYIIYTILYIYHMQRWIQNFTRRGTNPQTRAPQGGERADARMTSIFIKNLGFDSLKIFVCTKIVFECLDVSSSVPAYGALREVKQDWRRFIRRGVQVQGERHWALGCY